MQKTTEQEIAELQNRLKELQEKRRIEIEESFPIYTKNFNSLIKIESKFKSAVVSSGFSVGIVVTDMTEANTTTLAWDNYIQGGTEPCTPEEFEAARTETLKKLSEI